MSENRKRRKIQEKRSTVNEDEILLSEKWLVAFIDHNSKKSIQPFVFVRQFYAPGYYEAYDTVMTYAEKSNISILWFKQKGNCGYPYLNRNYPLLESFCIYCNKKFNHIDPIPCTNEDCHAEFCSKGCLQDHYKIRHKEK